MENTPKNPFSDSDENQRNNTDRSSMGNTYNTSDDSNLTGNDSLTRDDNYTTGTYGTTSGQSTHTPTVGSTSSNYSTTNAASGSRMLTGMFRDRDSAERAYTSLQNRGYSDKDINLMMSDETRKKHFSKDHDRHDTGLGNKAMEGAGVGSAIGGTLGAIVGAIAAAGTAVALPGLGLVIAGPIAAGLAGAGAGGLTGGVLGALVGSGIPEDRAREYETGIKEGGIVMGVHPRSEEDATYFENEWRNSRGEKIYR
jgi:hypothetical protein